LTYPAFAMPLVGDSRRIPQRNNTERSQGGFSFGGVS
jgi:hypothetical protein